MIEFLFMIIILSCFGCDGVVENNVIMIIKKDLIIRFVSDNININFRFRRFELWNKNCFELDL